MFGLVISSRPVIVDYQTISQTQFSFSIPSTPSFSHIVLFLLPGQQLPPGSAAAVYIRLTPTSDFTLLGAIANEKQSAIFKVKQSAINGTSTTANSGDDAMIDDDLSAAQPSGDDIVIGISLEPAQTVQAQLAALKAQSTVPSNALVLDRPEAAIGSAGAISTKVLAQRIIENAFNFLSSFGETVPLKSFENWWRKFEKKIELDPAFLEREN